MSLGEASQITPVGMENFFWWLFPEYTKVKGLHDVIIFGGLKKPSKFSWIYLMHFVQSKKLLNLMKNYKWLLLGFKTLKLPSLLSANSF